MVHVFLLVALTCVVQLSPTVTTMVVSLQRAAEEEIPEQEILHFPAPDIEEDPIAEAVEIGSRFDEIKIVDPDDALTTLLSIAPVDAMNSSQLKSVSVDVAAELLTSRGTDGNQGDGPTGVHGNELVHRTAGVTGTASELGGRAARRVRFGNPEANYAIDGGLNWLARHQFDDGAGDSSIALPPAEDAARTPVTNASHVSPQLGWRCCHFWAPDIRPNKANIDSKLRRESAF